MFSRSKLTISQKIDFSASPASLNNDNVKPTIITPNDEFNDDGDLSVDDLEYLNDAASLTTAHHPEPQIYNPPSNHAQSVQIAYPSVAKRARKSKEANYQEMLIVRNSLDFDESLFREDYARCESELILKMRKDIDRLYDWLDKLVADLTKMLNVAQEEKKKSVEEKLRIIREDSVRADAINRSIQHFMTSVHQAYHHTFAAFLCDSTKTKNIDSQSDSTASRP